MKTPLRIGLFSLVIGCIVAWSWFHWINPKNDKRDSKQVPNTEIVKEMGEQDRKPAIQKVMQSPTAHDLGAESPKKREELIQAFERAMQETSPVKKREATRAIIQELCNLGESEVAWSLIDFNAGSARDSQLGAFFKSAKLPLEQLLEKAKQLDIRGEAGEALRGIAEGLSPAEMEAMLQSGSLAQFITAKADQGDVIDGAWLGKALQAQIAEQRTTGDHSKLDAFLAILEKYSSTGYIPYETAVQAIASAPIPLTEKWQKIANLPTRESNLATNSIRQQLLLFMIGDNAEQTMQVLRNGPPAAAAEDVYLGMRQWLSSAPRAAEEWFASEKKNLSQIELSSTLRAFAERALDENNSIRAKELIDQVPDEKMRLDLLKKLESLPK